MFRFSKWCKSFGYPIWSTKVVWYHLMSQCHDMSCIIFFIQILMCTHVMVIKPTPFRDYMRPPQTPLRAYCCYSIRTPLENGWLWQSGTVESRRPFLPVHNLGSSWGHDQLDSSLTFSPLGPLDILGKISAAIGGPNMLVYHVWCARSDGILRKDNILQLGKVR